MNKSQLAAETQLSIHDISLLIERILGKHRGDPLPMDTKVQAVGRFATAMQTAIGDQIGWTMAEKVLLSDDPREELEVVLATHKINYPETVKKGRPQGNTEEFKMNEQVNEEVKTGKRGRTSKIAGARLFYDGDNPRRQGSFRHQAVELMKANPGITVEEFEAKGGRRQDILYEMKFAPDAIRVEQDV